MFFYKDDSSFVTSAILTKYNTVLYNVDNLYIYKYKDNENKYMKDNDK
jgi:hypothetical protein